MSRAGVGAGGGGRAGAGAGKRGQRGAGRGDLISACSSIRGRHPHPLCSQGTSRPSATSSWSTAHDEVIRAILLVMRMIDENPRFLGPFDAQVAALQHNPMGLRDIVLRAAWWWILSVTMARPWKNPAVSPVMLALQTAFRSWLLPSQNRGDSGHLMLRKRIAPQSEVIRAIALEDSPCCGAPHRVAFGEDLEQNLPMKSEQKSRK